VAIMSRRSQTRRAKIFHPGIALGKAAYALWHGECLELLRQLPKSKKFDLIVTSPPYNIGKEYETKRSIDSYLTFQETVIDALIPRLKQTGSICWQVGNYAQNGFIEPLDILLHPLFKKHGLLLRNRIVWRFGHGLHCKRRFSGRYEVVLWYTVSDDYVFDLDAVRIPSKYPGKRTAAGRYTGNPRGKNPEDVWDIPHVVGNHREKTIHPCQFPVGLVECLVLALTTPRAIVFDPFCGVGSTGVAAAIHNRRFLGADILIKYLEVAAKRINQAIDGNSKHRPHDQPIFDHRQSPLSIRPQ